MRKKIHIWWWWMNTFIYRVTNWWCRMLKSEIKRTRHICLHFYEIFVLLFLHFHLFRLLFLFFDGLLFVWEIFGMFCDFRDQFGVWLSNEILKCILFRILVYATFCFLLCTLFRILNTVNFFFYFEPFDFICYKSYWNVYYK